MKKEKVFSKKPKNNLEKLMSEEIPLDFVVEVMNLISNNYEDKDKKLEEIAKTCSRK